MCFESDTIQVRNVLELFSTTILRYTRCDRGCDRAISEDTFSQRMEIVNELINKSAFDGQTLCFCAEKGEVEEIPAFNYLVLIGQGETDYDYSTYPPEDKTTWTWSITGFWSFSKLEQFIFENRFNCLLVKDRDTYREPLCRFFFVRPNGEKVYIGRGHFYYPHDLNSIVTGEDANNRYPGYHYSFEICGLCEFQNERKFWCCIANSLDDIYDELENMAHFWGESACRPNREEGIASYNGQQFHYAVCLGENYTIWFLKNDAGVEYCTYVHGFAEGTFPECLLCDNLPDCFNYDRKISDGIISSAQLGRRFFQSRVTAHYDDPEKQEQLDEYLHYRLDGSYEYVKKGIDSFITTRISKKDCETNYDILLLDHPGARLAAGSPRVYVSYDGPTGWNDREKIIRISIDPDMPEVLAEDEDECNCADFTKEFTFIMRYYNVLMAYWNDWNREMRSDDILKLLIEN